MAHVRHSVDYRQGTRYGKGGAALYPFQYIAVTACDKPYIRCTFSVCPSPLRLTASNLRRSRSGYRRRWLKDYTERVREVLAKVGARAYIKKDLQVYLPAGYDNPLRVPQHH